MGVLTRSWYAYGALKRLRTLIRNVCAIEMFNHGIKRFGYLILIRGERLNKTLPSQ